MTVKEWVDRKEMEGHSTFSMDFIVKVMPEMDVQTIRNSLYRLHKAGRIAMPYRGFYVIVPIQYKLKGVVPSSYYIHQLMEYLGRSYYVSLTSAAHMHGATHQRSQRYYVTTEMPKLTARLYRRRNGYATPQCGI